MSYVDRDADGYSGRPLIATIVMCLLPLLRLGAPVDWKIAELPFGYKIGILLGALLIGAILWAIAWVITIRKASPGWQIASLIVIILVNLFVALVHLAKPYVELQRHAAETRSQMEQVAAKGDAFNGIELDSNAGPIARMHATILNRTVADVRAFDAEAVEVGMQTLSLDIRSKQDPVLSKCDRMADLHKRVSTHYAPRTDLHLQAAKRIGRESVERGELPASMVDSFMVGAQGELVGARRRWEIRAGYADASATVCRALRDRPWVRDQGLIRFADQRDADLVNRQIARTESLAAEEEALVARAKSNIAAKLNRGEEPPARGRGRGSSAGSAASR